MLLRTTKANLLLFFLFNATIAASALSSDPRLIQLVPPESQIIASMLSPTPEGQPRSFLLITGNNRIDLEDFFALTGADTSRLIHQVVFVAAGADGTLSEHSLLVSGHFNRDAIFHSAESGNARTENYRGEAILIVPPFTRELTTFRHLRWLAILHSNIAIFGTPASVKQELDRQIANSLPNPILMERLSRLDRNDETWCLLPAPSPGGVVQSVLERLDPKLGAVAREGGSMQYGIHFGRDAEITASSNIDAQGSSNSENDRPAVELPQAHYLLSGSHGGGDNMTIAVVKISKRRYEDWLARISKGSLTIGDNLLH